MKAKGKTFVSTLCYVSSIMAMVSVPVISVSAAPSYTTGFEDFTLGPLSSGGTAQNGWSGGAQPDLTNNEPGDEQIVNTEAHTGNQSWHYARGYNSPGQGTAFTPIVSPSVTYAGDSMIGSIWFKAHTPGDNSLLAVETGNDAGNDRPEILAYIDNIGGGITVRSFEGGTFNNVPIATGLDASTWHELSFILSRTPTENTVSISVDGGLPVIFTGSLGEFRDDNSLPYSESSRLKLRTRHADGDLGFNGFYLDDISYVVVPEPSSLAIGGLTASALAFFAARRRRNA